MAFACSASFSAEVRIRSVNPVHLWFSSKVFPPPWWTCSVWEGMHRVWGPDKPRASRPYKTFLLLLRFFMCLPKMLSHSGFLSWPVVLWGETRGWMVLYPFLPLGPRKMAIWRCDVGHSCFPFDTREITALRWGLASELILSKEVTISMEVFAFLGRRRNPIACRCSYFAKGEKQNLPFLFLVSQLPGSVLNLVP